MINRDDAESSTEDENLSTASSYASTMIGMEAILSVITGIILEPASLCLNDTGIEQNRTGQSCSHTPDNNE